MVAWTFPPRRLATVVLVAGALLAWPVAVGASGAPTARRVRLGDHPAFVRAVVDFGGGKLAGNAVEATDPDPLDGTAGLQVAHARVAAAGLRSAGLGIVVRVVQRGTRVRIAVASRRLRFKYLSYAIVGGTRLAVDLWNDRSCRALAEGRGACLHRAGERDAAGVPVAPRRFATSRRNRFCGRRREGTSRAT